MKELFIPPKAEDDPEALEIARVWIAHKGQHVSLRTGAWRKNPSAWGIMLCDLAHHVANAYEQEGCGTHREIFREIVDLFNAEAEAPTDEVLGKVVPRQ